MSRARYSGVGLRPISMPGFRPVLYIVGLVLLATAGMMLLPMAADIYFANPGWKVFAVAATLSAAIGISLAVACRGTLQTGMSLRQAFVLTPVSWFSVSAVSAIPFYFSEFGSVRRNLPNSIFEAVSGITTTGATVISGLDHAPHGLLLWRALLQWMGGIGIIASAIAILPALGIGGMQLFRTESSDRSEKAMPRVRQIAKVIALVYIGLTVVATIVYWFAGMRLFDAVAHALTSIATGGYSTSDSSFGKWQDNGIQWFATLFMLSGSIPFVLYVRLIAGEHKALWDRQVKTMLMLISVTIAILGFGLILTGQYDVEPAFRHAAFNTVSVVTTTGYATADYGSWGNAAVGLFFVLMFVGGCTGSTSGGIKIFRFELMAIMLRTHFLRLLYPRGVFPRAYGERSLDDEIINSVVSFFAVFFLCLAALIISLMALGLDLLTSVSGALTALANVGPGLGAVIGPAGNFEPLPDAAKWLLSIGMLLGRLELFTILILFMPRFWRG
jgi:trk system potassium uptake protein